MKVAVLGGGVSGLAAAIKVQEIARAKQIPLELTLFEASPRLGGSIQTVREGESLFELGPDAIFTEKPWGLEFLRKIGLESEIISTNSRHRKSFVAWKGRLYPVPEGFYILAPTQILSFALSPLFSVKGKVRALREMWIPPRSSSSDESLGSFVRRRMGEEVLERMAQPMVGGIHSADVEELSLKSTFPRFLELEQKYGSVIRGFGRGSSAGKNHAGARGPRYSLFVSLAGGMERMIRRASENFPRESIRLSSPVRSIRRNGDHFSISGENFEAEADAVVCALPAQRAGEFLSGFDPVLSGLLKKITYGSCGTVNLLYKRAGIPHALDGFGFVVPEAEKRGIIGCSFASVKFEGRAPEGFSVLRAFIGGKRAEEILSKSDEDVAALARRDLRDLLKIEASPQKSFVSRSPRSMAQYKVGHGDLAVKISELAHHHPGLALAGNYFTGGGIPDCVKAGEAAAERIGNYLAGLKIPKQEV